MRAGAAKTAPHYRSVRERGGRACAVLSWAAGSEDSMDPFARRLLGRSALELPALGLGGAPFGDLFSELGEANALATIEHACALGIGYFDTAPWYGCGKSEHRIGHVLRQGPRREFLISTKIGRVLVRPADPASYRPPMWAGGLP